MLEVGVKSTQWLSIAQVRELLETGSLVIGTPEDRVELHMNEAEQEKWFPATRVYGKQLLKLAEKIAGVPQG